MPSGHLPNVVYQDLDLDYLSNDPVTRLEGMLKVLKNYYGIYKKTLRNGISVLFGNSVRRTREVVLNEYDRNSRTVEWNQLGILEKQYMVKDQSGGLYLSNYFQSRIQYIDIIRDAIQLTNAKNIMDFGCGEGINIALYHKVYPESVKETLSWSGFDYAKERVDRAKSLLEHHCQISKAKIWQGDGSEPQVEPKSIDLTYSIHVLEQMPDLAVKAVTNMEQSSKYVLLMEPFYENKSLPGKLHTRVNGYFQTSIDEILDIGFRVFKEYRLDHRDPFNETTAILLEPIK